MSVLDRAFDVDDGAPLPCSRAQCPPDPNAPAGSPYLRPCTDPEAHAPTHETTPIYERGQAWTCEHAGHVPAPHDPSRCVYCGLAIPDDELPI